MKDKFVKALLDVCDTPEEVDEVFNLANIDSFSERCDFLIEKGVKYFDLPTDKKIRYELLKQMYTNYHTKFERKKKVAKEVISQIL